MSSSSITSSSSTTTTVTPSHSVDSAPVLPATPASSDYMGTLYAMFITLAQFITESTRAMNAFAEQSPALMTKHMQGA